MGIASKVKSKVKRLARGGQRAIAFTETLVLGDSHVHIYEHWYLMLAFPFRYFDVCGVVGATASGLENPNSKTQAYATYRAALRRRKYQEIIVMLGEVDTGFVIWYRAKKYGASVDAMFGQAVDRYCAFLRELVGYGKVIVMSCPLPTIPDDNAWGDVANLRKDVDTSQQERTNLALRFNRAIAEYCEAEGICFISLDEASLGDDGLVKRALLNRNPADHHYAKLPYARLIARHLSPLFAR
ncbi:MAG: SGNH/GDSL hydrolase family protein [Pseudomonadota bacterium]